jgi:uncharacterized membrane protein YhaH (DUF805 family)
VNTTALNCRSCNAPLTLGALRCDYCGNPTPAGVAAAHQRPAAPAAAVYVPPRPLDLGSYEPGPRGELELRTFFPAILRCFAQYAGFRGRAPLAEFWWFAFLQGAAFFGAVLVSGIEPKSSSAAATFWLWWLLLTFVPGWAVTVRRLHDVRRSGWNSLWWFTGIGALVVLILAAFPSDVSPSNPWGPPKPI